MRFTPNLLRKAGEILLLLSGCPRHLRCSGVQVRQAMNGSGVLERCLPAAGEVLVFCFSFELFLSRCLAQCVSAVLCRRELHDGQL